MLLTYKKATVLKITDLKLHEVQKYIQREIKDISKNYKKKRRGGRKGRRFKGRI
jgi:hypothetical protein